MSQPLWRMHCEWRYDDHTDLWDTGCDNKHCFIVDGPRENRHRYCPYCGGKISIARRRKPKEAAVVRAQEERGEAPKGDQ